MEGILNKAPWNMGDHLLILIEMATTVILVDDLFNYIEVRTYFWGLLGFIVLESV